MNTDEGDWMESASLAENVLSADRQIIRRPGYTIGLLVAAVIVAELTKDLLFSRDRGDWAPVLEFLYYGVLACLPFVLAKMAPQAAGFDTQWLPSARRQWAWFIGMLFVLIVAKGVVVALAVATVGHRPPSRFIGPVTPIGIVFAGIAIVVVAPVAEEIFFRGYVLEQLRKFTRSGMALLIQSLLFGLFHLYTRGLFTSIALFDSVYAFLFGMIVGAWRIRFRSLLPLVLAHVLLNSVALISVKARYDQVVHGSRPKHTISKETTYITEPLRKDGSVDYVAALNQRFSQGVTPENSAAVLFWKAVGPGEIRPEHRNRYFQMLGIPPLPEKGDYFVDLDKYLAQRPDAAMPAGARSEPKTKPDAYQRIEPALQRPWSSKEFPVLAAWLADNDKPLTLLVEASKRPRRFDPLVCREKTPLIAVLQPAMSAFHGPGNIVRRVRARAMLRLREGELEQAWEDLLTCHRLARLVGQGPTVMEAFVACSIEDAACAGDKALLQHAHLTATQAAQMREDLDRLPAMPNVADKLDVRGALYVP